MGQYWTLFNLDAQESIDPTTPKLPEIILNDEFYDVVGLLARPHGYRLSEPKLPPRCVDTCKSHSDDTSIDSGCACTDKVPTGSLGSFQNLPYLMLHRILAYMPSVVDMINLSMTSSAFFRVGHEFFQRCYISAIPRWAGHRLIALGDYAFYSDLPEGLFTAEESSEIEGLIEASKKEESESTSGVTAEPSVPQSGTLPNASSEDAKADAPAAQLLADIPEPNPDPKSQEAIDSPREAQSFAEQFMRIMNLMTPESPDESGSNLFRHLSSLCHGRPLMESKCQGTSPFRRAEISLAHHEDFTAILEQIPEYRAGSIQNENLHLLLMNNTHYEAEGDDPWILCNLTNGEYVRADAFTKNAANGPFFKDKVTFSDALIVRFCWSWDSNFNIATYDGWAHRGEWAGHRFEITTLSRLPVLSELYTRSLENWKDVSKEVVEDVVELYEAIYGEEWFESTEAVKEDAEEAGRRNWKIWQRLVPMTYLQV